MCFVFAFSVQTQGRYCSLDTVLPMHSLLPTGAWPSHLSLLLLYVSLWSCSRVVRSLCQSSQHHFQLTLFLHTFSSCTHLLLWWGQNLAKDRKMASPNLVSYQQNFHTFIFSYICIYICKQTLLSCCPFPSNHSEA